MAWQKLTDEQWEQIEWLLPEQGRGRPRSRNRECLDAILYILSTGCRWEELPSGFPPKTTVFDRFKVWVKAGFFKKVFSRLRRNLPASEIYHLDSSLKAAKKGRQSWTSQTRQRQQNYTRC